MGVGWAGEKTRLVPLDRTRHLDNCLAWLNDPEVTAGTLAGDFPLTRTAEEAFFERCEHPSDEEVVFAIETLDGEHIGNCGLHRIKQRYGEATTGLLIGRKDLWGQGFATDAARTRTRYAFDVLNLRFLLSECFRDNSASLRMLQKVGYQEVGCIPQRTWKAGRYHDVVILWLSRANWSTAPPVGA